MTEMDTLFDCFTEQINSFLGEIQLGRRLDVEMFEQIYADSQKLAEELKHRSLVPKFALHMMRKATKVLREEATYMREDQAAMIDMADKLEMMFDLILIGEDHGDRVPGVPRII